MGIDCCPIGYLVAALEDDAVTGWAGVAVQPRYGRPHELWSSVEVEEEDGRDDDDGNGEDDPSVRFPVAFKGHHLRE